MSQKLLEITMTEPYKLPNGWKWARLGEVCEFLDAMRIPVNEAERQKRIAGKKQSDLYPYYGANGQVGWIDDYLFDEELVLLAEDGGFFGSIEKPIAYKVNDKCWVNNHVHVLRAKRDLIDVDWLHLSLSIRPDIIQFVSGTTRPKLNQEQASLIPIPLPFLSVQRRIAIKLQELMQEVERARNACEKQLSAVKALPSAYLREVFESEEAKKWERKKLGEVCEFLDHRRIAINDEERQCRIIGKPQSELYPYYGANGQIGWIDSYIFDEELVLLAEDGGFFGSHEKPIAYRVSGKCWVNNHAHVLRPKNNVDIEWLHFSLRIRPDVGDMVTGSTRPKLNQEVAAQIPIPLPPLPEQLHIAAELKEKMAYVDKLRTFIEKQLETISTLPQAILRKAFRGEL